MQRRKLTKEFLPAFDNSSLLIKQTLKEVLYNSLAQAILKIFQTPHILLKVFLVVFVIVANGLCAYLILQAVLNFLSFEVITTTRTIFETPSLFPKVTICNVNPFATEYALGVLKEVNNEILPDIGVNIFDPSQWDTLSMDDKFTVFNAMQNAAVQRMNSVYFSVEDRKKLGHSIEDILFDCAFNFQPCSHTDFTWKFDKIYGNCYEFNTERNGSDLKEVYFLGALGGLKLSFYANFNQNLSVFNSFYNGVGALIRVENSSYLIDDYGGVKASAGFQTDISVERHFKSMMPKPYSSCETSSSDSELFQMISNSKYIYSQPLCLLQCFQEYSIQQCNCTNPWMLSLFSWDQCESYSDINCTFSILMGKCLTQSFVNDYCMKHCPLECQISEYKTSLSSIKLFGDYYSNHILKNANLSSDFSINALDPQQASDSVVQIYVFYESLSYTMSSETPQINWYTLISNIGGTLGLFMGVSLFSLCEIVECCIEIYFIKKKCRVNTAASN